MNNVTVKRFRENLFKANGNKMKMERAFKSISAYLDSSLVRKKKGQDLENFLDKNPRVKEIHAWSETVLVDDNYELVNY